MDYRRHFDRFCAENGLELRLSFDMPQGYEAANGTFDAEKKTLFLNEASLRGAPEYEQAFYLYHELRHAEQVLFPERFSETIRRSLPYTILFDGACFKLEDGRYKTCRLEGGEAVFTDVYLGQPYEVDANDYGYEKARSIFGDSEELRHLRAFWMPKKPVPADAYAAYYDRIDADAG